MNYRILHHHLYLTSYCTALVKNRKTIKTETKNRQNETEIWHNSVSIFGDVSLFSLYAPVRSKKNPRACSSAVHQMLIGWQFGQNWWQSSPGTRVAERNPIKYHMKRVSHRPFTPETLSSASTWQQALCAPYGLPTESHIKPSRALILCHGQQAPEDTAVTAYLAAVASYLTDRCGSNERKSMLLRTKQTNLLIVHKYKVPPLSFVGQPLWCSCTHTCTVVCHQHTHKLNSRGTTTVC